MGVATDFHLVRTSTMGLQRMVCWGARGLLLGLALSTPQRSIATQLSLSELADTDAGAKHLISKATQDVQPPGQLKVTVQAGINVHQQAVHHKEGDEVPRCTKEDILKVEGWLLDLDGTIYDANKVLDGATDFFDWLEESKSPWVLLSNGFKTRGAVAEKFASKAFKLNQKVDPARVYTAGNAVASYMKDNVPAGAKVFAVGSTVVYPNGSSDFLTTIIQRDVPKELYDSWDIRTDMTMEQIYEWAHEAKDLGKPVFVVQAFMGHPHDDTGDAVTGHNGYSTMDYELFKRVNTLLRNNAFYIVGAPDVVHSNPRHNKYPNIDTAFPTMGGMESLHLASAEMFPGSDKEKKFHVNVGKGGNKGHEYMMLEGQKLLEAQKPDINPSNIMIVGDNLGTDIKAGINASFKTMLVLTGAHRVADVANWKQRPTCYLDNVGDVPKIMK